LGELSHYPNEHIDYLDDKCIYHYPYLDLYWLEMGRFPYLLLNNNEIAGFALVRQVGTHWEMAEFYVQSEFRRHGLATGCAMKILKKHPGKWMIEFNKHNLAGSALWHKLANYSSKNDIITGSLKDGHDYVSFIC
jgi:predicted acetyltransferase